MSTLISGGYSDGAPPLPIPNREVKPVRADGTASSGRVGSRRFFPEESGIPHNVECRISGLYNMHQGRFRLLPYALYIRYNILYKVYGVDFGFIRIIYDFVIDDACVGL